jgi:hypothetical protein
VLATRWQNNKVHGNFRDLHAATAFKISMSRRRIIIRKLLSIAKSMMSHMLHDGPIGRRTI